MDYEKYGWIVFIFITIFIIAAVSNGANLTDGIDGLAAGSSAIIVIDFSNFCLGVWKHYFCRLFRCHVHPKFWGNDSFILAFAGALIGFLWYNTYPAQVFMGDTGSLTIGGIIAVIAIAIRKELLLPILQEFLLLKIYL